MWFFLAIAAGAVFLLNLEPRSLNNRDFMILAAIVGFVLMGMTDRIRR